MKISIEANALSDDRLTGVGMVILHYLSTLQRIDRDNDYFIHSRDPLQHISPNNPRWDTVSLETPTRGLRNNIRQAWLKKCQKADTKNSFLLRIQRLAYRMMKIIIEQVDEILYSKKMISFIKLKKIDVYIATSTYYFPSGIFSLPVKTVSILYDLVWKFYPETMEIGNRIRMKLVTRRNLERMDLLISISENTKKDTHRLLGIKTKIQAIPLAADKTIFYQATSSEKSRIRKKYSIHSKYILSVSTLEPRKNFKTLLHAFAMMNRCDSFQLVLVGMKGWIDSGYFSNDIIEKIKDRILFPGYVPNNDLAPLYSGAELFVFPSLYEGFGLPVLEAMQCGCPVIASDSSSLPEVIGDAGILVNASDPREIASAMENALDDKKLCQTLSKKGLRRAAQFSWEKASREFLDALQSLNSQ